MVRYSVAAWSLQVLALALFLGAYYDGALAVEIIDANGGAAPWGGIGDTWTVDPVDVNKKQKQESAGGTSNGKQANNNKAGNKNKAIDNKTGNEDGTPDPQNDSGINVWSLPKAIANVTGQEPLVGWEKYLSNDPFGEESGIGPIALIDSVGGLTWRSAIRCMNGDKMEVSQYGQELCIGVGEGICTADGWQFGIRYHDDNLYVMLWRKDDQNNPAYKWFPGAKQLCIGDQRLFGSNELDKNDEYEIPSVEYLRVVFDGCHYYLIGPGSVKAEKFAKLKISADEDKKKPVEVKIGKLWNIDENGNSVTSPDAIWYPIPCQSQGSTVSSPIGAKAEDGNAPPPAKDEKDAIEGTLTGETGASWIIPTKAPTAIPLSPLSEPKKACFWRWDASSTAKSPSRHSHHPSTFAPGMLIEQEDNDHRTSESPIPEHEPRTEQRTDVTATSKHLDSFAASPLDAILECDEEDNLSAHGMETTMSPSGNFTIVENRDARFRQWVGARSSKGKKGKKRPPRAPKKGPGSKRTGESHSPNIEK